MLHNDLTHVFNILKSNPPWLFGSEVVAHSQHAAHTARQPHSRPMRLLMAVAGIPRSVGRGSVYVLLDNLEQNGHVSCERLDPTSHIELLRERYGHGEQFARRQLEIEQGWAGQKSHFSMEEPLYQYVYRANATGGPKRLQHGHYVSRETVARYYPEIGPRIS